MGCAGPGADRVLITVRLLQGLDGEPLQIAQDVPGKEDGAGCRAVRAGELRVRREAAPASKDSRARRAARRSGRKSRGDKR